MSGPLARQSEFLVLRFSSILLAENWVSCEEDRGKRIVRTTEFSLANHLEEELGCSLLSSSSAF